MHRTACINVTHQSLAFCQIHVNVIVRSSYSESLLQFEQLILGPVHRNPFDKPVVIVIDGLDEGYDLDLLKIFRDRVRELSGTFRIFLIQGLRLSKQY
jgi:hypothetical protein